MHPGINPGQSCKYITSTFFTKVGEFCNIWKAVYHKFGSSRDAGHGGLSAEMADDDGYSGFGEDEEESARPVAPENASPEMPFSRS